MLQRRSKPVRKARRVAEQRVEPLKPVLLVDRILGGVGLTKQPENDGIGRRRWLRVSRLFDRGLTRGERDLTRRRPIGETDLIQRLGEQPVGRGTHEEAQVSDRGKCSERITGGRIELFDDVVDDAIQPLGLIVAALSQEHRHRFADGRPSRRHRQVILVGEALAERQRLFERSAGIPANVEAFGQALDDPLLSRLSTRHSRLLALL